MNQLIVKAKSFLLSKLITQDEKDLERERIQVLERTRIHEQLFKHASISFVQDGRHERQIFSMGVIKLEEILMPPLSERYTPDPKWVEVIPAPHPSFDDCFNPEPHIAYNGRKTLDA